MLVTPAELEQLEKGAGDGAKQALEFRMRCRRCKREQPSAHPAPLPDRKGREAAKTTGVGHLCSSPSSGCHALFCSIFSHMGTLYLLRPRRRPIEILRVPSFWTLLAAAHIGSSGPL